MKTIEVDDQLYSYIASQTRDIGESASDILRRLLDVPPPPAEQPPADAPSAPGEVLGASQSSNDPVATVAGLKRLLASPGFMAEKKAINRFMMILTTLYQLDKAGFTAATEIKGTKRVYFGRSELELLEHGSSTKPRQIPGTPYWVITNTNTGRKRNIVAQLMADMGYAQLQIELISQAI